MTMAAYNVKVNGRDYEVWFTKNGPNQVYGWRRHPTDDMGHPHRYSIWYYMDGKPGPTAVKAIKLAQIQYIAHLVTGNNA